MASSDNISSVSIEHELNRSYLDYAMSVIVGRALPDARDGLKPVHRRTLFAMNELRNTHNRPYVKSARVVGEVIGKYHPHGDTAVYDTIVRMAQEFSMRVPLIDGQGNFGSVDGDAPAAQRYTEVRMTRFAGILLEDLDKETVNFVANYDDTLQMPEVLPSRAPNLLINGSAGIAVGMATNIPPHNPGEVIRACLALLNDPEITLDGLMEYIQGPDFPTAAIINGRAGILEAYRTGRGGILIRSKAEVLTEDNGRQTIIVHEIPYQVNKANMIEKIAALVKEKKLTGISEIRDESNKDGIRVVIEIRRDESAEVVLNNLYTQTQLQKSFGINMLALVDGRPQLLDLKAALTHFLSHRKQIVIRRSNYLLTHAKARGHLLEGQLVALSNIDRVVELIKQSKDAQTARKALTETGWQSDSINRLLDRVDQNICRPSELPDQYGYRDGVYYLSEQQAQAILELRLQRLTGLEQDKVVTEYDEIIGAIKTYQEILANPEQMTEVIRLELEETAELYTSPRMTEIIERQEVNYEDLIDPKDTVVMLSQKGYAKSTPVDDYDAIARGGKGRSVAVVQQEDFLVLMLVANTRDVILCFTNTGKVYWLRVYKIPSQTRLARGRPLVNLLNLTEGEQVTAFLPMKETELEGKFIFMATADGRVKRTRLSSFARQRSSGLIALRLARDNVLVKVAITDGTQDILLVSSAGKATRFNEQEVRSVGRTAAGVRGMRLGPGERLVSMIVIDPDQPIVVATERGYGKRVLPKHFVTKHRGGKGLIIMRVSEHSGALMGAIQPSSSDELMLISDKGHLLRTSISGISLQGRSTKGVRLMSLPKGEKLIMLQGLVDQDNFELADPSDDPSPESDDPSPESDDPSPESDDPSPEPTGN